MNRKANAIFWIALIGLFVLLRIVLPYCGLGVGG